MVGGVNRVRGGAERELLGRECIEPREERLGESVEERRGEVPERIAGEVAKNAGKVKKVVEGEEEWACSSAMTASDTKLD